MLSPHHGTIKSVSWIHVMTLLALLVPTIGPKIRKIGTGPNNFASIRVGILHFTPKNVQGRKQETYIDTLCQMTQARINQHNYMGHYMSMLYVRAIAAHFSTMNSSVAGLCNFGIWEDLQAPTGCLAQINDIWGSATLTGNLRSVTLVLGYSCWMQTCPGHQVMRMRMRRMTMTMTMTMTITMTITMTDEDEDGDGDDDGDDEDDGDDDADGGDDDDDDAEADDDDDELMMMMMMMMLMLTVVMMMMMLRLMMMVMMVMMMMVIE